jgi:hypothetical protein
MASSGINAHTKFCENGQMVQKLKGKQRQHEWPSKSTFIPQVRKVS